MSAQVDVLEVLDHEIQRAGGEAYQSGRDLIESRAAVAALIAERDALRDEADRLQSIIDNAGGVECATCGGRGEVGGPAGQTPEQFEYVTEPCPECQGDVYGSADAPTPLGRMQGVQP